MAYFQVYLRGGVHTAVEVSDKGVIVSSSKLENAVGMNWARFSGWVRSKGGEIVPVNVRPDPERTSTW